MNKLNNTMKRILLFTASLIVTGMAFGIGINSIQAAPVANTNTATKSTPANLQPASGQKEYRATDGTTGAQAVTATAVVPATAENTNKAEENSGIVGMFGLNWKLFLAQLINFGIILFVLWKWVFGPVTKGLSDRTEKIEHSLEDAKKIAEERETFDSWKQGEISQVRTEASAIILAAKSDAEKLKTETLEQTKLDQAKLVAQAQVKLEQEKQAMLESAKNELADIVVSATESILKQKLDPKRDAALIDEALKQAKGAEMKGSV
ncbi:MAG TPA: F0F1 ATP synthase subunit B [Patescibacteria group bacterium]|nr:F0F1 ATP synthase subunit B [Patescibacteria group bacterium]